MNIHAKLLLACGSILLATAAITSFFSYREIAAQTEEDLAKEAGDVRAMLMATRRVYHLQFLASGLPVDEKTVGFLPAHALARISKDFPNWSNSGLYFNNVSDRPRNPDNQADAFELEAIAWFRANPEVKQRVTRITAADGKNYYHYTAPLRIEAYCLKCHGDRQTAPATISSQYSAAFDYQVGDLRGVMSIKIPTAPSQAHVWSVWRANLFSSLGGFVVLFLCLGILFRQLVTSRLRNLEQTAGALAAGDYTRRTRHAGNDEVSSLSVAIDRMADAVEKRDHELQRFSEITAHHLQEPARRLASYAERLKTQLAGRLDDPEAQLSLDFIGQQARRMKTLLVDVERYLAADQPRGDVESVDVQQIVAGILERYQERLKAAGAHVTVGALPPACIDAPRLTDLFEVALNNALQYVGTESRRRRHGGGDALPADVTPRITIDGERHDDLMRYSVSDNGPGIEEEYRERVFRVFERLRSEGEGTGIGLAIGRRIAESCGGRAWVEEAQGGGCRVVFELRSTLK